MIGLGIGLRLVLQAPVVGQVLATIHNTRRSSTLPTGAVAGFAAAFDPLATRRAALRGRLTAAETAISNLQQG